MRLLHADTIGLQEFPENEIPPYAILSHTWEKDEVSFQDMQEGDPTGKEGYIKIKYACEQALSQKLEYVWVDTCCIDKRSSSELSEVINSMFRWYRNARTCYAYLVDVPPDPSFESGKSPFRESRWFTRGWTLQELIAPRYVIFWSRDWTYLGSKGELGAILTEITGIDDITLRGGSLGQESVAKRMSWASKRVTTRKEDIAYCLLGIFGVNMPMLYGEGDKAFIRLQEEIIKETDDQSLFAWGLDGSQEYISSGILASSPADFATAGNIMPCRAWNTAYPPSMTSKGLRIEIPIYHRPSDTKKITPYGLLSCHRENDFLNILALPLRNHKEEEFSRLGRSRPFRISEAHSKILEPRTIYIKKQLSGPPTIPRPEHDRLDDFLVRRLPAESANGKPKYRIAEVYPPEAWNPSRRIISTRSSYNEGWRRVEMQALILLKNDDTSAWAWADLFVVVKYTPRKYKLNDPQDFEHSQGQCYIAPKPGELSLKQLHQVVTMFNSERLATSLQISGINIKVSLIKEKVMGVEMFVIDIDIDKIPLS